MPSVAGRLLVSAPPLVDPNFDRTVVFVIEHTLEGAIGVIINRPTSEEPDDLLARLIPVLSPPALVFEGGPVETEALVALGRRRSAAGDEPGGVVGLDIMDDSIDDLLIAARVYRGYSGWGAGQLDDEIESGAWIVVAEAGDVFDEDPSGLWRRVLRRQPGRLAWLAEVPDDLQAN